MLPVAVVKMFWNVFDSKENVLRAALIADEDVRFAVAVEKITEVFLAVRGHFLTNLDFRGDWLHCRSVFIPVSCRCSF